MIDDTYYSTEGAFKVRLPHPPNSSKDNKYEWTYTKVNEIKEKWVVGVIFGPAAFDQNRYYAVLIRRPLGEPKDKYVEYVFSQKIKSRTGQYIKKTSKIYKINGKNCYYAVYESDHAFLILSLTDNGDSFYAVQADVIKQQGYRYSKDDLSRTAWPIFNIMLESFVVLNSKYESR